MATDYFWGIRHILYAQLCVTSVLNLTLVRFDRRLDPFLEEFRRLLRSPSYESTRVEEFVEVVPDGFEELVGSHSVDQVVLSSLLFDDGSSFVREHSDLLVADLSVSTLLDDRHDNVLGSHEREFLSDSASDDRRVNYETLSDVLKGSEDDVGGEERFRNGDTTVCGVIESSLEPLNTRSHQSVLLNRHQMSRQRTNTFTSHRVPLVSHRTRTNLILLERFLDFFQVRKETNIGSDFVSGSSEGRQGTENVNVNFARVGLSSYGVGSLESGKFRNEFIEFLDLVVILFEEGEEGSLSTSSTLDTSESDIIASTLNVSEIPKEFLDPESSSLSDGSELSRLEVSPSESREILVLIREFTETFDNDSEFREDDIASVSKEDEVGVVGNITRSSTEMDDTSSGRGVESKYVDVSHDIVSTLLLFESSFLHLGIVEIEVGLHLFESLI